MIGGGRGRYKGVPEKVNAAFDAVAYTPDIALHIGVVHTVAFKAAKAIGVEVGEVLGAAFQECLDILRVYDPAKSRVSTMLIRYGVPRTVMRHRLDGGDWSKNSRTGQYTHKAWWKTMGGGKNADGEREADGPADGAVRSWRDEGRRSQAASGDEIAAMVESLSVREYEVLRMRLAGLKLGDIGTVLGCSKERVRQNETAGLRKLSWGVGMDVAGLTLSSKSKDGQGDAARASKRAARRHMEQVQAAAVTGTAKVWGGHKRKVAG